VLASLPRSDQRRIGQQYVAGLLAANGRKSMRGIAAVSGGGEPLEQRLHHFISNSTWAWQPVRRRLAWFAERSLSPTALVVSHLAIPKAGDQSIGVFYTPQTLPWLEAMKFVGTNNPVLTNPTVRGAHKSAYMRANFADSQIETMFQQLTRQDFQNPDAMAVLLSFGGKINTVDPSATAAAQRSSAFKGLFQVFWGDLLSGVLNAAMETGPTIGLAALVSIAGARAAATSSVSPSQVTAGYGPAFTVAGAAVAVVAVTAAVALRPPRHRPGGP
jgi:hypothetical protein